MLHLAQYDAPEPTNPIDAIKELVRKAQLFAVRFSSDMKRNPRAWLLGYFALTGTAVMVGSAVAGGTAAAIAAAPKKDVRKYKRDDWGKVGNAFVEGASKPTF